MVASMAEKLRVLFVDDDPAAARLYRSHLTADGHEVVVAHSGIEGVEATERGQFDVVVMDLNMPGLDGWMSMSLIRARRPKLPVVVLTGDTGKDLEARARTAGAAGFLTKPCQPDDLIRALKRAIAPR
jgi:two-component system, chemotaxis family, chemotaxis protein CheY